MELDERKMSSQKHNNTSRARRRTRSLGRSLERSPTWCRLTTTEASRPSNQREQSSCSGKNFFVNWLSHLAACSLGLKAPFLLEVACKESRVPLDICVSSATKVAPFPDQNAPEQIPSLPAESSAAAFPYGAYTAYFSSSRYPFLAQKRRSCRSCVAGTARA